MRIVDQLENGTNRDLQHAKLLRIQGYDQDQIGEVTRNVAALWERSLKASDSRWANMSLFEITNLLRAAGWSEAAEELHFIRSNANRDKHEPSPLHVADRLIVALTVLKAELGSLKKYAPGVIDQLPAQLRIRRMICAVYENFHQGETIYSLLEAEPTDTWQTCKKIDEFQVANKHDDYIEGELAKLPNWSVNPPELNHLKKSLEFSDSNLWQIMHFDASYQEIHDIMAPHQHDFPLLSGLHREDDALNFVASVAQAVLSGGLSDLFGRSPLNEQAVRVRLEALIVKVPERLKPLRLDRCSYSAFQSALPGAIGIDTQIGALVTDRGVLLVRAQ